MKPQTTPSVVGSYVDALLQCTGQLMLIVDHMTACPSAPDAPPVDEVLRKLLLETLEPELGRRPEIDLEAADAIIVETVDVIGRNLYMVEPGACGEPGGASPPRRRRKRR